MVEPTHRDHRKRLRERFLRGNTESNSDTFLLELLLTFAIGRKDVRPLADELMRVFGSLSHAPTASQNELKKVKGLGQSSIALLKVVDFIRIQAIRSVVSKPSPDKITAGATQQKLFQNLAVSPDNANEPSLSLPSSRPSKENIEVNMGCAASQFIIP